MAAAADIDFESARLAVHLERNDVLGELDLERNPNLTVLQQAALNSRLTVLNIFDSELEDAGNRYAGQRVQQSMYRAMLADTREIAATRREEQQAVDDRAEAARLGGEEAPPVPEQVRQQQEGAEHENERLAVIEEMIQAATSASAQNAATATGDGASDAGSEHTLFDGDPGAIGVSLEQYVNAEQIDESRTVDCMVCTDAIRASRTTTLPCGDAWCCRCLIKQFEEATISESAWPPKCCRVDITSAAAFQLLPADLRARFTAKSVEWSTSNRTYCRELTCSTFIPPDRIVRRRATCPACNATTCKVCKGETHSRSACPDRRTTEDHQFEAMAQANEWAQCPNCHRYVELRIGCNHMTCPCRTQFCYVCSAQWKDCECEHFNEDRLLEGAHRAADREGREDVEEVAREIAAAHECVHPSWQGCRGGICEECDTEMPNFLYTCRACHISVCRACKNGRVQNRA